jgi:hypothetical protein
MSEAVVDPGGVLATRRAGSAQPPGEKLPLEIISSHFSSRPIVAGKWSASAAKKHPDQR